MRNGICCKERVAAVLVAASTASFENQGLVLIDLSSILRWGLFILVEFVCLVGGKVRES